ncbi:MAG: type II-A CRISPR-associated protein Csn2 [Eubacteriales bacterium]|nr:type II-A CRISPR-associated protein Csn2 [Eubacteriales bacterium]
MKIVYMDPFFEIDLQKEKINTVVIEVPELYSEFLENIWNQMNGKEGKIHLSMEGNGLRLDRKVELIMNPFAVSCNERKILNTIYSNLKSLAQDELIEEITELNLHIITFLDEVIAKEPYMLTYDLNLDIAGLLKLYNISVEEEYTDILDRLVTYLKLSHSVTGKELFVFYNLKNYLSERQMCCLLEAAEYEQVMILNIEANHKEIIKCFESVNIIDKDYCIITIN